MTRKRPFNKIEQVIISIPRWVLRIALLLLLIPFVLGVFRFIQGDIDAPSADKAPICIQTYLYSGNGTNRVPSRFYLGELYATIDGVPTLNGYWEYDGKKYIYHHEIKPFSLKDYGPVDIIWRKK